MPKKQVERIEPKLRSSSASMGKGPRTPVKESSSRAKKQPMMSFSLGALFRWGLKWGIVMAIWTGIAFTVMVLYYAHDLPNISGLQDMKKNRKVTILAEDGSTLANFGDLYAEYGAYEDFPPTLINAVLATEDRRFFTHYGIDPIGLLRAAYMNYRAGHVVQGGSTISQQLAKVVFLNADRTIKRKFQELILALYLEHEFTKKQILTIYLNRVYMGAGIYGVPAAAKYYFGKNVNEINLYESAMIAGLLKAPSRYSPTNSSERAGKRTYQILVNMKDAGFITDNDLAKAQQNPIMLETSALGSMKNPYFADWVMEQVPFLVTDAESDLVIRTTLNGAVQEVTEKALIKALTERGEKLKASQGAAVVMTPDGKVLAMVGGKDYNKSSFNRAIKAQRQPGSSFKTFVYLTAFENGYSPDQPIADEPIKIKKWQPKNYDGHYAGIITLREAFYRSINTVAVRISEEVGRDQVISMAHSLGINSPLAASNPSIALGSTEVNLLELTGSYATLANNGYSVWPYGIEQINTSGGKPLYSRKGSPSEKVVSDTALIYIVDVLSSVIEEGTGKGARLDRPAAGKTGTTNDYRDAWFVGFTPEVVTGVWVGNDNNEPMKKVTGGGLPAQIWKDIMMAIHNGRPVSALRRVPAYGNHGSNPMQPVNSNGNDHVNPQEDHHGESGDSFWKELMNTLGEGDGKVEYTYPQAPRH